MCYANTGFLCIKLLKTAVRACVLQGLHNKSVISVIINDSSFLFQSRCLSFNTGRSGLNLKLLTVSHNKNYKSYLIDSKLSQFQLSRDDQFYVQKYFCFNMASGLTPPELATQIELD